ncbi:MAG: hypothetical protein ABI856_16615, partial [Nitrospira sp.]
PARWSGDGENATLSFSVIPTIDLKQILDDDKFDETALNHLESLGGKIDAKPLVRDYLASIGAIHESIRASMKSSLLEWETIICEAIESFSREFPDEGSVLGLAALAKNVGTNGYREVSLFAGFIEYRKNLETQTSSLSTLGKRYVTSQAHNKGGTR